MDGRFLSVFALLLLVPSPRIAHATPPAPAGGDLFQTVDCTARLVVPIGIVSPEGDFRYGCTGLYVFEDHGDGLEPGAWSVIDLAAREVGPCTGARADVRLRCEIANGKACCTAAAVGHPVATGAGRAAAVAGVTDRWMRDSDRRENICYENYRGNGSRIMLVPLIQRRVEEGRTVAVITGFAELFLRQSPRDGMLVGEFIR